ncbi:MAG: hypothetical protein ACREN8_00910 [Candidatus Dormibacteraceae bacterium]
MGRSTGVTTGTLVLDSEGVVKIAHGKTLANRYLKQALASGMRVIVSAITLTEIIRNRPVDAPINQVLSKITQLPVTPDRARAAGALLGRSGLKATAMLSMPSLRPQHWNKSPRLSSSPPTRKT